MSPPPVVDAAYRKAIEEARQDLTEFIARENCAPLILRFAWMDAGTYDKNTKTGGANGSIRVEKEPSNGASLGTTKAIGFMEPFKSKYPILTYADLYQLAGVVCVEVTGGPRVEFIPGREDSTVSPPPGSLPNARKGAQNLRDQFYRMGLNDQEIVVLSGGHTLGRAHHERSGFEGPWTTRPLKFDNLYFKELLNGPKDELLQMPSDSALVQDPDFKKYVEAYAKDEELFFRDYAPAHQKLSELGQPHLHNSGANVTETTA